MKLVNILLEQEEKPRALIMSGGGGAGKSYLLNKIKTGNIIVFNPDKYVEDPSHPMYNNLGAASSQVKKDVISAIESKKSFVWDTTGRNLDIIRQMQDEGYELMVIMVYTHPVISFISNFERGRSIPKSAIFSTWQQAYDLIDDYRNLLGDRFMLFSNLRGGQYDKMIADFNKAAQKGGEGLLEFIDGIVSKDPEKYQTTFSKPFDIQDPEALQAYEEEIKGLKFDEDDESLVKQLKRHFMNSWEKKGTGPGRKSMETKIKSIERTRDSAEERYKKVMDEIAKMILSPKFNEMLTPNKESEIISKANNFLR